ncbi:type II secretion system protein GspD [Vibrio sp. TBV020]|uniref:type II secretion system protein GspD n=1 Tax=Vibrio sp. TBV020 TaxID=3137398 RepID=UPI0038CD1AC7
MSRHPLWLAALLSTSLLTGCEVLGLNEFGKRNQESGDVRTQIDSLRVVSNVNKVERIEQPPVWLEPLSQQVDLSYLQQSVRYTTPNQGELLSSVLDDVLGQFNKSAWYGESVNPEARVNLDYQGSIAGLLNQIERQLEVGFTPQGEQLLVEQFVSRTFELELPPGVINDQLGSGDTSSNDSGEEEGSAKVEGQFVTLTSSDVNTFQDVAQGIETILKSDVSDSGSEELVGSVQAIQSLSRIVVRTTPTRMAQVVELVSEAKASLGKQVLLEALVLEFRSNLGHNRGIDWNLVRDVGDGNSLNFFIPGTDLISQAASPGLAFTGGGKWSGSTALINALNQQGQVSTETPITILVQNHQTNHITQERVVEFMENLSSDSSEGVVSSSTERGKRREGVDFIAVPNIQRDHVYLRLSGMLTKIEALEPQVVGGETLIFPQMREAKINFANKLKYGQTIVIASVSQTDTTTEQNTFLGIPFLGGSSAVKQRVDTLVLLTPRRADG